MPEPVSCRSRTSRLKRCSRFGSARARRLRAVARMGALVWNRLQASIEGELDPNLVRAVLANSASVPAAASNRIEPVTGDEGILRVCGYGLPDDELALESGDRRVTLIAQDRIAIDTLILYEIPIPDALRNAPGKKTIIVSLAFDPPVRRRRAEYLGVEMGDEPVPRQNAGRNRCCVSIRHPRRTRGLRPAHFAAPHQCDLLPKSRVVETSTLQRREWSFSRETAGLWRHLLPDGSGAEELGAC